MVSTRSSSRQIVTRSKTSNVTEFKYLDYTNKKKKQLNNDFTKQSSKSGVSFKEYDVIIDFDDASECWMQNKRKKKNGNYSYICGKVLKNKKKCQRDCSDLIGLSSGCKRHYKWEEKLLNDV